MINSGVRNEIFNIAGNCEQTNRVTVEKIIDAYFGYHEPYESYLDLSYVREGQDVRYALDDSKLQNLGWKPVMNFDKEIKEIVTGYKSNYRW